MNNGINPPNLHATVGSDRRSERKTEDLCRLLSRGRGLSAFGRHLAADGGRGGSRPRRPLS